MDSATFLRGRKGAAPIYDSLPPCLVALDSRARVAPCYAVKPRRVNGGLRANIDARSS
jgi:hypothetical protein